MLSVAARVWFVRGLAGLCLGGLLLSSAQSPVYGFDAYADFCIGRLGYECGGNSWYVQFGYAASPTGAITWMPYEGSLGSGFKVEYKGLSSTSDPKFYRNTNIVPVSISAVPPTPARTFSARSLTAYPGIAGEPTAYAAVEFVWPPPMPPFPSGPFRTRLEFSATQSGSGDLDVQLFNNGTQLFNANLSGNGMSGGWTNILTLGYPDKIRAVIGPGTNSSGDAGARLRLLTQILEPPIIWTTPSVYPSTVRMGSNAYFSVSVFGTLPLSYQWLHDFAPIPGGTNQNYTLTNAHPSDAGPYWLIVTNVYGAATSSVVTLNVDASPRITRQPRSILAQPGELATFGVEVHGQEPMTFQWLRAGTNFPSTSSSNLAFTVADVQDAGFYSVIVTNASGSVTSAVARLYSGTNFICDSLSLSNAIREGGHFKIECDVAMIIGRAPFQNFLARPLSLDARGRRVRLESWGERLFRIDPRVSVTLTGLELVGGDVTGSSVTAGGIFFVESQSKLVLRECLLHSGRARSGGAIHNNGEVFASDCIFSNNVATGTGGAVSHSFGDLTSINCVFRNNYAIEGGALGLSGRALLVSNLFTECEAALGGAIRNSYGNVTISACRLLRNRGALGGGVYNTTTFSLLRIDDSVIADNVALAIDPPDASSMARQASGGGIYSPGQLWMNRCLVVANQARGGRPHPNSVSKPGGEGSGGGIWALGGVIEDSLIVSNQAIGGTGNSATNAPTAGGPGFGGGIYSSTNSLRITNSTIAFNVATGGAPGGPTVLGGTADGGGIYAYDGLLLNHCTIANNVTVNGTGSYTNQTVSAPPNRAILVGCILNGGVPRNIVDSVSPLCGYNVSSDNTPYWPTSPPNWNNVNPRLGPLADNGGPTPTFALLPGSPALDVVPASAGSTPATDQRGIARPYGPAADAGAFELTGASPPMLFSSFTAGEVEFSFSAQAGQTYRILSSTNLQDWTAIATNVPEMNKLIRFNGRNLPQEFLKLAVGSN